MLAYIYFILLGYIINFVTFFFCYFQHLILFTFHQVGGFDLSIRGWGKEDVDLYTKFIEYEYNIFRAIDPGMTHIFHPIQCSSKLEEAQMVMCVNSKAMSYASTRLLANSIYSNPEILRRLDMHYLNRGS